MRPLSVRAFDAGHWMVDADLCDGLRLDGLIRRFLANENVDYLQVHFAKPGCYAARVERIDVPPPLGYLSAEGVIAQKASTNSRTAGVPGTPR